MKELIGITIILFSSIFASLGALFFKKASASISFNPLKLIRNREFMKGFLIYGGATVIGLPAYRFAELSLLYPFIATSYIWTCILSVKYLNEHMNRWKWTGIGLIIIGVSVIGIGN